MSVAKGVVTLNLVDYGFSVAADSMLITDSKGNVITEEEFKERLVKTAVIKTTDELREGVKAAYEKLRELNKGRKMDEFKPSITMNEYREMRMTEDQKGLRLGVETEVLKTLLNILKTGNATDQLRAAELLLEMY